MTIAVLNASGFLLVRAVYDQDFQARFFSLCWQGRWRCCARCF